MVPYNSILICLSIHLICTNMDKPPNLSGDLTGLTEDVSPINVVLGKLKAITKGIINMSLCSKVHNRINGLGD